MEASGWLPNQIGPVEVQKDGAVQTARGALNFKGCKIVDNAVTDSLDITPDLDAPTFVGTVTHQGTNTRRLEVTGEAQTDSVTPAVVASFAMVDETMVGLDFKVVVSSRTAATKGGRWCGDACYQRTSAGDATILGAAVYSTPQDTGDGDTVLFDVSGATVRVLFTSADTDPRNITCELRVHETVST